MSLLLVLLFALYPHFGTSYTPKEEARFARICEGKVLQSMKNIHTQFQNKQSVDIIAASSLANSQTQQNFQQWLDTRFFVAIINDIDLDNARSKRAEELFLQCLDSGTDLYLNTIKDKRQKEQLKAFLNF